MRNSPLIFFQSPLEKEGDFFGFFDVFRIKRNSSSHHFKINKKRLILSKPAFPLSVNYNALVSLFSTAAFMNSASLCSYCSFVLNTLTETQLEFTSFSPTISI